LVCGRQVAELGAGGARARRLGNRSPGSPPRQPISGLATSATDLRAHLAPWPRILERTGSIELADDPDFDRLAEATLADLFDELPVPEHTSDAVALVFGPGAALAPHDVLWYMDTPKV
jgi:hypothetical protein